MADEAGVLTLDIEHDGSTAVVKCKGRLVAGVDRTFSDHVKGIMPHCKRIVLDLSELERMDSMGLGALVKVYASCRGAGCELQLLNLGKQVRGLLGLTHMLDVFSVVGEHGVKLG